MSQENEQKDQQEQEKGKILKAFNDNITRLEAIVKGKKGLLPKKKADRTELASLVEEMFKEENEAFLIKVKEDLKALLKGYAALLKKFDEEEKKLAKAKKEEMKKFNEEASKLFKSIDDIPGLLSSYTESLKTASQSQS